VVASFERAQGVLWRVGGGITQGDVGSALVGWWWHHSRVHRGCSGGPWRVGGASLNETRWGTLVGSGGLVVASLKETQGLLSRFDCVYSDYTTQGCLGGALAVAMSLRARCFFFHTHTGFVVFSFDTSLERLSTEPQLRALSEAPHAQSTCSCTWESVRN
jgi:hypothetical protein